MGNACASRRAAQPGAAAAPPGEADLDEQIRRAQRDEKQKLAEVKRLTNSGQEDAARIVA